MKTTFQTDKTNSRHYGLQKGLQLNAISLNQPPASIKAACFAEKSDQLWMVHNVKNPESGNDETMYTSFNPDSNQSNVPVCDIPLRGNHHNIRKYFNYLISGYFSGLNVITGKDFIINREVLVPAIVQEYDSVQLYHRFLLVTSSTDESGPLLWINYLGASQVSLKNLTEEIHKSARFSRCIYKNRIFRFNKLKTDTNIPLDEVFPVLNRSHPDFIPKAMNNKNRGKYQFSQKLIHGFTKKYLDTDGFRDAFPFTGNKIAFRKPVARQIDRIDNSHHAVMFGGNHVEQKYNLLDKPLRTYGPYKRPAFSVESPQVSVMCIGMANTAQGERNKLETELTGAFKNYAGIHATLRNECILIRNTQQAASDLRRQLSELKQAGTLPDFLIYVSPFHKTEQNRENHQLYYRVMEEIAKFGVPAMCITRQTLFANNFSYSLPNLCIKMIFRLGGLPWVSEKAVADSLVIGISAYSRDTGGKKFVAASCFFNESEMKFDSDTFLAHSEYHIADMLQKALATYFDRNHNYQRVVIHYYKKLNKRESRAIRNVLKELKATVPVYILHITQPQSRGKILFNYSNGSAGMPGDGTYYIHSDCDLYVYLNRNKAGIKRSGITGENWPLRLSIETADDSIVEVNVRKALVSQLMRYSRMNYHSTLPGTYPLTLKMTWRLARNIAGANC